MFTKQLKNFLPEMKKLIIIVLGGIYFITLACIVDKNIDQLIMLFQTSYSLSLWPWF